MRRKTDRRVTEEEQQENGLLLVVIVVLLLFCALKVVTEHPDWLNAEVRVTEPGWHASDAKPKAPL